MAQHLQGLGLAKEYGTKQQQQQQQQQQNLTLFYCSR